MHFNAPKSAYPYSLALPFLNRLEKRKSKPLFLLAPSRLGKQGLPSELQQRPWPLPHGPAHFSSTVFFHISPNRSLTWHQHPWLNPLPFWAQNYLINRNWTYVRFYAWREFYFYYTPKRHVSGLSGRFHLHRLAALAHSSFYSQLASRAAVGVHPYGQGFTAKLEVPKQRCNFHAIICTASLSTLGSTHHLTPTASAEKHVVAKRSIAKRLLCLGEPGAAAALLPALHRPQGCVICRAPQRSSLIHHTQNCQRNTITLLQQPKVPRGKLKIRSPHDFLSLEPQ